MLLVRRVVGSSMAPTLEEGDIVVAASLKRPRLDRIVIARKNGRELIKRVSNIDGDACFITGDNASASTDSRSFGPVSRADVRGVIILKMRPALPLSMAGRGALTAAARFSRSRLREKVRNALASRR
jgi:hypothetical protein